MEEYSRLQVWDHREEKELLILRPGYGLESVEDTYFVHEKTEVADDNCMFHNFCIGITTESIYMLFNFLSSAFDLAVPFTQGFPNMP